jgi:hypothetical protein
MGGKVGVINGIVSQLRGLSGEGPPDFLSAFPAHQGNTDSEAQTFLGSKILRPAVGTEVNSVHFNWLILHCPGSPR